MLSTISPLHRVTYKPGVGTARNSKTQDKANNE